MILIDKSEVVTAINSEAETLLTHCLTDGTARLKLKAVKNAVEKMQGIKTKSIKYYDEEEQVWKIGEVIVNG